MQITKIERLSKRKALYHLYADDALLMTISEETLLHFQLRKGQELSDALQEEIFAYDQWQRCLQQSYRYLSRRNHFRKELERKLRQKNFPLTAIEKTVEYLEQKGYLNDLELTGQFIREAVHLKQYGPNLIKGKLLERGVPGQAIDQALEQHYPQEVQSATCKQLALKKLKSLQNLESTKARQKLSAFLQQRGFSWEIIQPVLEHLFNE